MIPKFQLVTPILFDTYIAFIENSVGAESFKNYYARVNGKKQDIMKNGELSCAFFASSILTIFNLVKRIHGTVEGIVWDLKKSGWEKIDEPKIGSVLVWEVIKFEDGSKHKHIGFYIGDDKAISNNAKSGKPEIHHWTYGVETNKPVRRVEMIFWNSKLG